MARRPYPAAVLTMADSAPAPVAALQGRIRAATPADSAAITALSLQLGYAADEAAVAARVQAILQRSDHVLLVFEAAAAVVAFAHLFQRCTVETDMHAELAALVTDKDYRSHGIGGRLLAAAEQWARTRGCAFLYLRSNVIRERAHGFYERLGYTRIKTQFAFRKKLLG
jgi:GNAT superfamily N-acetyltransferase